MLEWRLFRPGWRACARWTGREVKISANSGSPNNGAYREGMKLRAVFRRLRLPDNGRGNRVRE